MFDPCNIVNIDYLQGYVNLFNTGIDINQDEVFDFISSVLNDKTNKAHLKDPKKRKSLIETYNILTLSNTCIKLIDRDLAYKEITKLEYLYQTKQNKPLKIKYFLQDNRYFFMIPLQDVVGNISGFILREISPEKGRQPKYVDSDKIGSFPLMFGFYKDFLDYDSHKKSKPIVICEGLKDALYLKQYYPYVLANNTSKLGANLHILNNLTNKFILVYDNDPTGKVTRDKDSSLLRSLGAYVSILDLTKVLDSEHIIKDTGELINYPEYKTIFKNKLLNMIEELDNY